MCLKLGLALSHGQGCLGLGQRCSCGFLVLAGPLKPRQQLGQRSLSLLVLLFALKGFALPGGRFVLQVGQLALKLFV